MITEKAETPEGLKTVAVDNEYVSNSPETTGEVQELLEAVVMCHLH